MAKNTAVFGIYKQQIDAANAVERLRAAGFRKTDLSVLFSENAGNKDFGIARNTKAPEGAVAGASSGAVVGGALGWLAGIGVLAFPEVGPLIAAGPIIALLTGVGVGGTVGGITGALIGAGTPEFEAKRYEGRIRGGRLLLSVHCDNSEWVSTAKDVLKKTGAEDISSTSEAGADFDESDRPHPRRGLPAQYQADFRRDFEMRYGTSGANYDDFAPLYEYGYQMASSPRYQDHKFEEVEPELKVVYLRDHPGTEWEKVSSAVLYGWERAGGRIAHPFALI